METYGNPPARRAPVMHRFCRGQKYSIMGCTPREHFLFMYVLVQSKKRGRRARSRVGLHLYSDTIYSCVASVHQVYRGTKFNLNLVDHCIRILHILLLNLVVDLHQASMIPRYSCTGTKFSTAVRVVLSITFIPPLAAARQQPTSGYSKLIMKFPKTRQCE
jgi:hypothetical protein